jgi:hypothetical protein
VSFQNAADYLFIASIMYLADIQCYLSDKFQILTNVMVWSYGCWALHWGRALLVKHRPSLLRY